MKTDKQKYRLGRKESRVILTNDGTVEVAAVSFTKGHEVLAKKVVDILNSEIVDKKEYYMFCYIFQ